MTPAAGLPQIGQARPGGGRLRCTAQRGYWQVYDGLAPGAGVLGSTFAAGATQVVRDLGDTPEYIRAVPDVVAEICVPLLLGGRVAGALNVECKRPVDDEDVAWVEATARAFEDVVRHLGGVPVEEPAELLARLGYELATIADGQELGRHTLTAALTVSGMSSAALIPGDGSRPPVLAEGPLAPLLLDLPVPDAQQLVEYVARATSSWAIGLEEGDGFEATRALRARGVSSLVVLALVAKGRREGVLVLVDQHPQPGLDRVIPLLEMLAATAAAMLAAASASAALQLSERELAHQVNPRPADRAGEPDQAAGGDHHPAGRPARAGPGWWCCSWTWTGSRRSTTCTATGPVTGARRRRRPAPARRPRQRPGRPPRR